MGRARLRRHKAAAGGVRVAAAAGLSGRGGGAPAAVALRLALLLGAALGSARAAVYFQEQFLDGGGARAGGQLPVMAVRV